MTDRLRRLASLICSARTIERVIDPVLADVHNEGRSAVERGLRWRARWIRLTGCVAFAKVLVICAFDDGEEVPGERDERPALSRSLLWTTVATGAFTVLLMWPQWSVYNNAHRIGLLLFVIPSALSLAIPAGLIVGLFIGLQRHNVSRRIARSVVTMAAVASLLAFANTGWLIPLTNQAYRVRMAGNLRIPKGANELTLGELRQMMQTNNRLAWQADRGTARQLAFGYYMRWSLAAATFVFAIFALAVIARHHGRRIRLAGAALSAFVLWYVLLLASMNSVRAGTLPPLAGAWFPDAAILMIAFGVLNVGRRPAAQS